MVTILQTTFSNVFSWMKILQFWLKFHWNKCVPRGLFNNIPALFHIMAWCLFGATATPLSDQWWPYLLMHICVTGPQGVNSYIHCDSLYFIGDGLMCLSHQCRQTVGGCHWVGGFACMVWWMSKCVDEWVWAEGLCPAEHMNVIPITPALWFRSGTHFTGDLGPCNPNLEKIHFILTWKQNICLGHKSMNVPKAELLGQN